MKNGKKYPKNAITTPLTKLKYTWLSNTKKIMHQENVRKDPTKYTENVT